MTAETVIDKQEVGFAVLNCCRPAQIEEVCLVKQDGRVDLNFTYPESVELTNTEHN